MFPGVRALSVPDFRRLFIGQAISQFGDGLYYLMILFVADKVSGGQPWALALVGFCQAIPFVVFGPIAGQIADRWDRRLVMLASDYGSAAVTLGLSAYALMSPVQSVWIPAMAGFGLSTVAAFFMPARSAAIPRLVPPDMLMEANALSVATQQVVIMIAQGFSAVVLGLIQNAAPDKFFPLAAALNGVTFLVSAVYIASLPKMKPSLEGREHMTVLQEIGEGVKAVRGDDFMPAGLVVSAIFHLFVSGWMVTYVRSNSEWFGGHYWTLSVIELSFFVVLSISSMFVGKFKVRRIGFAFLLGNIVTGLLCLLMAWGTSYPIYVLLNALCGIAVAFIWLPVSTYIQSAFPDELRGRASSLWGMVQQGVQPFGYALIGPMLALAGLSGAYIIMGAGMAAGGLLGFAFPRLVRSRMPESALAEGAPEPEAAN